MQRHQHLARELSKYLPVIYMEETESWLKMLARGKPFDSSLNAWRRGLVEIQPNMFLFKTPPCSPRQFGYRKASKRTALNDHRAISRFLPTDKKIILLVLSPYGVDAIGLYDEVLSVFDIFDNYGEFPGEEKIREIIRDASEEAIGKADLVLATHEELREWASGDNPNSVLLKNGCDPGHFKSGGVTPEPSELLLDISTLPGPVIGYMGDIADWMAWDCITTAASRHPDWSFVLLGTWKRSHPQPSDMPNIYVPGRVSYETLPYYANQFTVGTIPFILNELTRVVNPLKLYEYFSMGIPVVSTPLPEIVEHEGLAYVAGTPDEFNALLEVAVREGPDAPVREKRIDLAMRNSWQIRGEELRDLLVLNLEMKGDRLAEKET